jgi:hypothetical protein
MAATGRCLCGAVTFTVENPDNEAHCCHCSMCRRWSGGPALVISSRTVSFTGEDHIKRYQSSDWAERAFCSDCGSNLFYRLKQPETFFLPMGLFDDQSKFTLVDEIYIDNKPQGYDFVGEHPRLTEKEFLASIQQS